MRIFVVLTLLLSILSTGCGKKVEPKESDNVRNSFFGIKEVEPNWKPGDKLDIRSAVDNKRVILIEHKEGRRIFIQPSGPAKAVIIYVKDDGSCMSIATDIDIEERHALRVKTDLKQDQGVLVVDLKDEMGIRGAHSGKEWLTYRIVPEQDSSADAD